MEYDDKCPYCGADVGIIDSIEIYQYKSYGWAYACSNYPECDAYVGCHQGTQIPLGTLANKELRELRHEAHQYFDELWKYKVEKKKIYNARYLAYNWLSNTLNIPLNKTHIGMFDKEMTLRVIEICKPLYYKIKERNV